MPRTPIKQAPPAAEAVEATTVLGERGRGRSGKRGIVLSAETGRYSIDGVPILSLVNRHPDVKVQAAPGKPRHLSRQQITEIVKRMKVA